VVCEDNMMRFKL